MRTAPVRRARSLAVATAALSVAAVAGPAAPARAQTTCGTSNEIQIANMTWLSAQMLANVTQIILSKGYGCKAVLVPGNTVPTGTSMLTKNKPHIAPEFWVTTTAAAWARMLKKGNVFPAGEVFTEGGKEGWWIPDYVAKNYPGLKSMEDLKKYAHVFREAATGDKGRIYACPPGWACEIVNSNLFKALGMAKHNFELFSPGSGANLKASIARKVARKQPVVAYYWGPTAVIGRYNLVRLKQPAYDKKKFDCLSAKDCANPQPSAWPPGKVVVAVVSSLKQDAPAVVTFLSKMQYPNATVNEVLAWADARKANGPEIARYFLKQYPQIWKKWVPADVAARVTKSLN